MGFHRSQVLFYLLSAFLAGVFTASFMAFGQSAALVILLAGIGVIMFGYSNRPVLLAGFLILAFAAGVVRFEYFNNAGQDNISSAGDVVLVGFMDSEPIIEGNRSRFVVKSGKERILVTTNAFPRREFGDVLELSGRLEEPKNFTEFDYVTYLKKDGIRLTMFYPEIKPGSLEISFSERLRLGLYVNIFKIKNIFQDSVNLSVPEPNASFINGILLGTRQNIPDDLKEAFSATGTTHILAISGYNIMIISEAVLLGLVWFFRRRVSFWISVGVIILFVILTGASASVVRAAVMGLLLSFAHGYGRLYDQKNSIILAGAVMVYANPFVLVFDIGFQLSFAAVLGLIYLYPFINSKLSRVPDIGEIKELALMTISAQVAVLPLILYYFGKFSLLSVPANILILPFIPVSMLLGFITGLFGMIYGPAGRLAGYLAWAVTDYQLSIVKYFASLII